MNIIIIAIIVGLLLFIFLHKQHGVKQKVSVYGNVYYIKTYIFLNGTKLQEWSDVACDDEDLEVTKKSAFDKANTLFNSINKKSNEI